MRVDLRVKHDIEARKAAIGLFERGHGSESAAKAAEMEAKLAAMDPEKAAKVRAALAARAARDKQKKEA